MCAGANLFICGKLIKLCSQFSLMRDVKIYQPGRMWSLYKIHVSGRFVAYVWLIGVASRSAAAPNWGCGAESGREIAKLFYVSSNVKWLRFMNISTHNYGLLYRSL